MRFIFLLILAAMLLAACGKGLDTMAAPTPVTPASVVSKDAGGAAGAVKPAAAPAPGAEKINAKDGAKMVYVPAGPFLMGSKDGQGTKGSTRSALSPWMVFLFISTT